MEKDNSDKKILLWIIQGLIGFCILIIGYSISEMDDRINNKANQTEVEANKIEIGKKASKTELRVTDERVNGLEIRFNENVGNILFELRELRKDLKLKEDKRTSYIIDSLYIPFALAADK